ncbi:hypothetical protein NN6n1_32940 [Shinella zoogloeoides]
MGGEGGAAGGNHLQFTEMLREEVLPFAGAVLIAHMRGKLIGRIGYLHHERPQKRVVLGFHQTCVAEFKGFEQAATT